MSPAAVPYTEALPSDVPLTTLNVLPELSWVVAVPVFDLADDQGAAVGRVDPTAQGAAGDRGDRGSDGALVTRSRRLD